ncbi:large proline-rich protein BAG6 isoform X2 [Neltuma alba]|uniref:large proline-rich protein BAG6 isoform X2 n=1 Tax=Neltuma alba TaxID=207710 RepID=UPI0010A2ED4E|nr:large proline-rich protein BAG6 isoform X2 [Prosopis alba]XP_028766199.1 large proline-rich protein BAG6 isoform X2 [Prosopis alba]
MAGQSSNDGPSASNVSVELSDSTVQLNIKTLDSQIYTFQVDKNMLVSLLKEKIANEVGVPVGQQRLIFRGKVLNDNHVLSEYHIENGDTLHLVQRQLNQSQAPGTSSGETTGTSGNRDASSGALHNRVGQISHSVVLGTFNVGEQGEGIVPDLSRVIGAVLNSIGIGGQSTGGVANGTQSSSSSNPSAQGPSGNEAGGTHLESQNQSGNQAQTGQTFPNQPFQSLPQAFQIPLAAGSLTVPSLSAPIPHSLDTLSEFINRMEQALSQNGYQTNSSSMSGGEQTRVELPSNPQGLPTVEALSVVLHRAEQLLSGHAIAALSHIAGRLEREGTTSDPNIRGQIQSESMQLGLAMQHLGAFLLELGRTILTLRMGQSSAESAINAGPAVYISPSGPNPIMVQPFPLQTSSLFGSSVPSSSPATFGTVGVGSAPRNVNIHIHAGTPLAPIVSAIGSRANNGEGAPPNERRNAPGSGDLGSMRALPVRNIIAAAVPAYPAGTGTSSGTQSSGVSTSQLPSDSIALSSVIADINSRARNILGNMQGDSTVLSGRVESTNRDLPVRRESRPTPGNEQLDAVEVNAVEASSVSSFACSSESGIRQPQPEAAQTSNNEERDILSNTFGSTSSNQDSLSWSRGEKIGKPENVQENAQSAGEKRATESTKAVPLGLGMSGLERKRRTGPQQPVSGGADDGSASSSGNQNQESRTSGLNILQALASHGTSRNQGNANGPSQVPASSGDGQIDMAGVMSQVLHSPALNGLLTGVSQQTGVGSPDVFRNMLQQFTQSPQMRNTVNQIAQQVGSQDMGNVFAGMERGQGSGIDFSRMLQQMMPIVSQALGGGTPSQSLSAERRDPQALYGDGTHSRDENIDDQSLQINLQPVVETMEHLSTQSDVFRGLVENAIQLSTRGSSYDGLLDELCGDECLASDYMEMLRHDVNQRLNGDSGRD